MKKILLYIMLLAVMFAACDPIEDSDSLSGNVSVSDLKLTCTPIVVDGKNSNDVIVENNSSTLSRWLSDRTQIETAYGTVTFDFTGNRDVIYKGFNGDGSTLETTIPVTIDTITNILPAHVERLGIKYKEDGSADETSLPYYFGTVSDAGIEANITIVQEVANGKNGNVLTIKNNNPILSDWNWGGVVSDKNSGELFVTSLGDFDLTFTGTKADGSIFEIDYGTFTVDSLTKVPQEYINLFGDFLNGVTSKKWAWFSDGPCWANGGYLDATDPDGGWWKNTVSDMEGREVGILEFTFDGYKMTKTVTGGNDDPGAGYVAVLGTTEGTVKVDLSKKMNKSDGSPWSIGHMTTTGINVLYGLNVNDGNALYYEYDILKLTDKELVVAGTKPGTGSGGESWIFKFEAVE